MGDIAPTDDDAVEQMWAAYVAHSGHVGQRRSSYCFGDSAEMADALGDLVLHGPKRATAGMLAAYEADDEPLPRAGDHDVVTGGDGRPLGVVRTTDVRVGPLSSVDDRFAWDEGEGDRSRRFWLEAHTAFFSRQCSGLGVPFHDELAVVFERFELVWPRG